MAKPKAPRWLTEAFRDGVDERDLPNFDAGPPPVVTPLVYAGANPACSLAHHDPARRPCSGPLERFHFIPRQRVENALWAMLRGGSIEVSPGASLAGILSAAEIWDLILLAAWDPRNGGIGCEGHHRRKDNHATPPLPIDGIDVPGHVLDFTVDYGLEAEFVKHFGGAEVAGPIAAPFLVL